MLLSFAMQDISALWITLINLLLHTQLKFFTETHKKNQSEYFNTITSKKPN